MALFILSLRPLAGAVGGVERARRWSRTPMMSGTRLSSGLALLCSRCLVVGLYTVHRGCRLFPVTLETVALFFKTPIFATSKTSSTSGAVHIECAALSHVRPWYPGPTQWHEEAIISFSLPSTARTVAIFILVLCLFPLENFPSRPENVCRPCICRPV
jgi:hypothetical protein